MGKFVATGVKIYAESLDEYSQIIADANANQYITIVTENASDGSFGSITIDINELGS